MCIDYHSFPPWQQCFPSTSHRQLWYCRDQSDIVTNVQGWLPQPQTHPPAQNKANVSTKRPSCNITAKAASEMIWKWKNVSCWPWVSKGKDVQTKVGHEIIPSMVDISTMLFQHISKSVILNSNQLNFSIDCQFIFNQQYTLYLTGRWRCAFNHGNSFKEWKLKITSKLKWIFFSILEQQLPLTSRILQGSCSCLYLYSLPDQWEIFTYSYLALHS